MVESFQVPKRGLRLLCQVVGICAAAATPLVAKLVFVAPSSAPQATNSTVTPSWGGISFWWLFGVVLTACVAQIGALGISHSLEKEHSALDEAICGMLLLFHRRAFAGKAGCRVTLLQVERTGKRRGRLRFWRKNEEDNERLVPTHRFSTERGVEYVGKGKRRFSVARFRYGSGIAGFAWEAHCKLASQVAPDGDDAAYEIWAKETLKMSEEELKNLSARARRQKYFGAWGFLDVRETFLGVVAVDSKDVDPYDKKIEDPAIIFEQTSEQLRVLLRPI